MSIFSKIKRLFCWDELTPSIKARLTERGVFDANGNYSHEMARKILVDKFGEKAIKEMEDKVLKSK